MRTIHKILQATKSKLIIGSISALAVFGMSGCFTNNNHDTLSHHSTSQPEMGQLIQKAENGDSSAQYLVAYRYYYGINVREDQGRSKYWMQRSARHGNRLAKQALNDMSHNRGPSRSSYRSSAPRYVPTPPSNRYQYSHLMQEDHSESSGRYTLGLYKSKTKEDAQEFVTENRLRGDSKIVENTDSHGKKTYEVVHGKYRSSQAAREEVRNLPSNLKEMRPSIVPYKKPQPKSD